jgi:DNA-binding FadR family transcriptional regulator
MIKARPPLHREVAEVLCERILSGEFPEKSLLPTERALCEEMGVSRTVVREAVKFLESRGLVRVERGRGMIVQEPQSGPVSETLKLALRRHEHVIEHLMEVRKMLEVGMAALAAERRTEQNLEAMRECLSVMRAKPGEPEGYVDADVQFHAEILKAAQNPVLLVLFEPVEELLRKSRKESFSGPRMVKLRTAQHEEVYERIAAGDPEGAKEAMSRHLSDTERDVARRQKASKTRTN